MASLFYLLDCYEEKLAIVGLAFTCALGAATLLEAALGFCLGWWVVVRRCGGQMTA